VPWVEASASTANSNDVDERTSTVEPRCSPPWGSSPATPMPVEPFEPQRTADRRQVHRTHMRCGGPG
jgi:hypothetical protein